MLPAIITIGLFIGVYVAFVRPRVRVYRYVAGVQDRIKSGTLTRFGWFREKLEGFKTVILAGLAGIVPMLPQFLDQLGTFTGWSAFIEQNTANRIAAVCAVIAMVTHAAGVERAAKATPKE